MANVLIGLGSNIGERAATLEAALTALGRLPETQLGRASRFVESRPVGGGTGQGSFLNGAVILDTSLSPERLLDCVQGIEDRLGRQRTVRWGPRTLDLDLLLYGELVLASERLTVPHPRMAWRRFVLEPAVEIASDMVHPLLGWTLGRLLRHLDDTPPYVAIGGAIGAGKSTLLRRLAEDPRVHAIWEELDSQRLREFYADPGELGWRTECEFLNQRLAALDSTDFSIGPDEDWAVSDFWFDQSDAFAEVWLPPEKYCEFHEKWIIARRRVITPKLIVLLEAAPEVLERSIACRGRQYESELTAEQVGRIQEAIACRAMLPNQGPSLRVAMLEGVDTFSEVRAALDGMRPL